MWPAGECPDCKPATGQQVPRDRVALRARGSDDQDSYGHRVRFSVSIGAMGSGT